MWIVESIHNAICLVGSLIFVRDIRLLVENEKEIHEITRNPTPLWKAVRGRSSYMEAQEKDLYSTLDIPEMQVSL